MSSTSSTKQLRYRIMLALYLPILLYSFSTFDLTEDVVAFTAEPTIEEGHIEDVGKETSLVEDTGEPVSVDSIDSANQPHTADE